MLRNIANKILGIEEYDELYEAIEEQNNETPKQTSKSYNEVQIEPPMAQMRNTKSDFSVVIVKPIKYEEVKNLANELIMYKPIIVDFGDAKKDDSTKMYSFLCGTVFALGGKVQQLNENMFMFTTKNIKLETDDSSFTKNSREG